MSIRVEELPGWINNVVAAVETPQAEPVFKEWLSRFVDDIGQGFNESRSPFGEPWAALKRPRSTRHNQDPHPLIDTGALMRSVISQGSTGNVVEITSDTLRWGTSIPYAADHQLGTSLMPARPFLSVNQDQVSRAAELFAQQIIKALKN